jgi:AcrR family transcriptional regulator
LGKTRQLDLPVAAQRRRQIIDAAQACVAEVGVERTTIREVARRAGLSHTTVVKYFRSMHELLDAAMLEEAEKYLTVLRARQQDYSLRGLADLMRRFLRPDVPGPRFVVKVIESGLHDLELRTAHNQYVEFGVSLIERSVRSGIQAGDLREDLDPRTAARMLHSLVIWWASEIQEGAVSLESAEQVTTMALELLKPHEESVDVRRSSDAGNTVSAIRGILRADHDVPAREVDSVMRIFEDVYLFAVGKSRGDSRDKAGDDPHIGGSRP